MRRKFVRIGVGNRTTGREYTVKIYYFDLVVAFLLLCIIVALHKNGAI